MIGPIDKAAADGQVTYCKDICAALRTAISSRSRSGTGPTGAPKSKKRGKKGKALQSTHEGTTQSVPKAAKVQNWGLLEPVRPVLEPLTDLLKPLLTGNVMYGLLVGLLVSTWFGFGVSPRKNVAQYGADRFAAYEEMWHREDSELWDWLEDRVGLDRLSNDVIRTQKKVPETRTMEDDTREKRMETREVEEAIRVTEEKLRILKETMAKGAAVDGVKVRGENT